MEVGEGGLELHVGREKGRVRKERLRKQERRGDFCICVCLNVCERERVRGLTCVRQ